MGVLKGSIKNQTRKNTYTIVIYDDAGFEIDTRKVQAENAREAVKLAFKNIFSE